MPVITSYLPGTFCWAELGTTDAAGAKQFYSELLGWSACDTPLDQGRIYSIMQADGRDAAAIYQQGAEERAGKVPPHWLCYVAVASADDAAKRITDAGGAIVAGPFDVFDAGRMCLARDPTGATFAAWQARQHKGAGWANDPGGVVWNELLTPDTATASQFYARTFGWAAEAQQGPMPYTIFKHDGRPAGGMLTIDAQGPVPPCWAVYFAVADCDAAVERAKARGGRALEATMEVAGVGRFAPLADPQGAVFSVMQAATPT
jgi:hypothetical protein